MKDKPLIWILNLKVGQNAAQMWKLSRILPLILEHITDTESPQWSCFISVLEIMGICFAQKITSSSVLNLKPIVKKHLNLFKETYAARIIPKQHYLVHLTTPMMMFGALVRTISPLSHGSHIVPGELKSFD